MSAEGIRAGRAYVELGINNSAFVKGLNNASRQLKSFGTSLMAAGGAITAPLVAASKVFEHMGDDLDKMSKRTGVSVETLSKLNYAVELSGASMEDFEKAFRKLQKNMGSGDAEANLKALSDQIAGMDDPTEQTALALEYFGRSGTKLLPFLKEGSAGIQKLMDTAKSLGLEISTNEATAAAYFHDRMTELWMTIKRVTFEIGEALMPTLLNLVEWVRATVFEFKAWVEQHGLLLNMLFKLGAALTVIGGIFYGLGVAAGVLTTIMGGLTTAINAVNLSLAFLAANPIVLLIGAVVALGVALAWAFGLFDKNLKKIERTVDKTGKQITKTKDEIEGLKFDAADFKADMNMPEVETPKLAAKSVTALGQEFDARNMAFSKLFYNSGSQEDEGDTVTHQKLDNIAEILRNNRVTYVEE